MDTTSDLLLRNSKRSGEALRQSRRRQAIDYRQGNRAITSSICIKPRRWHGADHDLAILPAVAGLACRISAELAAAIQEFGFPVEADQLAGERILAHLGQEPFKIKLLNFVLGLEFSEAMTTKGELGGVTTTFISKESPIKNKSSTDHTDCFEMWTI